MCHIKLSENNLDYQIINLVTFYMLLGSHNPRSTQTHQSRGKKTTGKETIITKKGQYDRGNGDR